MSKRTISITPQYFNMSTKKNKKVKESLSQVNINTSSIRQLLLDKLKEHKKTRKIETNITPLQEKTFDESCKEVKVEANPISSIVKDEVKINVSNDLNPLQSQSHLQSHVQSQNELCIPDKPYGNLKNGTKPTYKQMNQILREPRENPDTIPMPIPISEPIETKPIILEEKEVKKTFKLGKNDKTKTISVLIKNNKTRKKVEDAKTEHKKKNMSTIKNYLKEKNLIKFGTTAPSKLLREMFESSELCGGISNENKDVLIHNFDK